MSFERGFIIGKDQHGKTYRVQLSDGTCPWCGPEVEVRVETSIPDYIAKSKDSRLRFCSCRRCGRYSVKSEGDMTLRFSDGSVDLYHRLVSAKFYNAVDEFRAAYKKLGPALKQWRSETGEFPSEPWMDISGARELAESIMKDEDTTW